ncbi:MAG: hypothetical protein V7750_10645 [Sneathiella sp.]
MTKKSTDFLRKAIFTQTPMKRLAALGLCLMAISCTNLSLEETERAKIDLIGLSKSDLLSCVGAPDKTADAGNHKQVLSYSSEKVVNVPTRYPTRVYSGFGYPSYPFRFYSFPASQQENRVCTVTFSMEKDLVTALSYRLNDDDRLGTQQCYQIVKNCLPERKVHD